MRFNNQLWNSIAWILAVAGIGVCVWLTRNTWQPLLSESLVEASDPKQNDTPSIQIGEQTTLELNKQARDNLGLISKPVKLQNYWKVIDIPGEIIDRPGVTDQGITSPLKGVVTQVHAFAGDVVRPGERLFSIRLVSDSMQVAQSGMYKAIRETEIIQQEQQRIEKLIESGIVPGKRMIELKQEVSRQVALIDAHQQELVARGINEAQISKIKQGEFITTIDIRAPLEAEQVSDLLPLDTDAREPQPSAFFEIQKLMVELGYQVDPGAPLAILANHQSLYIKGHAFKQEASRLAAAAENGWPVDVEFTDDVPEDWKPLEQEFQIRHLANSTDPGSRTFDFFLPLANQSRVYEKSGRPFIVWRFRPGQRVRISVPLEEMQNVIVLPATAVYQNGPEAFVFQQNGDLFNRLPVKLLHQDRTNIVIANDGSLSPGFYLAQNSAASLNRILKSQTSDGGLPPGTHVHADGSVHGAH